MRIRNTYLGFALLVALSSVACGASPEEEARTSLIQAAQAERLLFVPETVRVETDLKSASIHVGRLLPQPVLAHRISGRWKFGCLNEQKGFVGLDHPQQGARLRYLVNIEGCPNYDLRKHQ